MPHGFRDGNEIFEEQRRSTYLIQGNGEMRTYNLAIFTIVLFEGKLLSTFPSVLSLNVRNPPSAIARHAINEIPVE